MPRRSRDTQRVGARRSRTSGLCRSRAADPVHGRLMMLTMARFVNAVVAFLVILGLAAPALAQSPENVVVVINDNSPDSQRVGEHYIQARAIPSTNVIRIRTLLAESIERREYG